MFMIACVYRMFALKRYVYTIGCIEVSEATLILGYLALPSSPAGLGVMEFRRQRYVLKAWFLLSP